MQSNKVLYAVIVILFLFLLRERNTISEQGVLIREYEKALAQANENIDDANSYIEEAQSSAWSDYDDMGAALESLQTVNNVSILKY